MPSKFRLPLPRHTGHGLSDRDGAPSMRWNPTPPHTRHALSRNQSNTNTAIWRATSWLISLRGLFRNACATMPAPSKATTSSAARPSPASNLANATPSGADFPANPIAARTSESLNVVRSSLFRSLLDMAPAYRSLIHIRAHQKAREAPSFRAGRDRAARAACHVVAFRIITP